MDLARNKAQPWTGAIRPLDLVSTHRPGPIEPDTALITQHGTSLRPAPVNEDLRRFIYQGRDVGAWQESDIAPPKRRKLGQTSSYDLPKLPVRTTQDKRPRLPPTLSGLYQPPPNAGLLPSISTEHIAKNDQPIIAIEKDKPKVIEAKTKVKRKKWSATETTHLLRGVARFGIGNWTKILKCDEYDFGTRTALDLKDRFRVCCPEQYGSESKKRIKSGSKTRSKPDVTKAVGSEHSGPKVLFQPSQRRMRHPYTEVEDQQLLRGFQRYGKSWSSIQQDMTLNLSHRTRTDLRDRMRHKFPDILTLNDNKNDTPRQEIAHKDEQQGRSLPMSYNNSGWLYEDPYLSMAFEDTEFGAEAITLDRGILDWASTQAPNGKLVSGTLQGASRTNGLQTAYASLPSLSTMTTVDNPAATDDRLMYELPALTQYFDTEDRPSTHAFPSLEELLG